MSFSYRSTKKELERKMIDALALDFKGNGILLNNLQVLMLLCQSLLFLFLFFSFFSVLQTYKNDISKNYKTLRSNSANMWSAETLLCQSDALSTSFLGFSCI